MHLYAFVLLLIASLAVLVSAKPTPSKLPFTHALSQTYSTPSSGVDYGHYTDDFEGIAIDRAPPTHKQKKLKDDMIYTNRLNTLKGYFDQHHW